MSKKVIPDGKFPKSNTTPKPIPIRFSETQLEQLEKDAKRRNLNRSAYIRAKLFEDRAQDVIIVEGAELMRLLANTYNAIQDLTATMRCKVTSNSEIKKQLDVVLSKQGNIIAGFNEITANISFLLNYVDEIKSRFVVDEEEKTDSTDYVEDKEEGENVDS